MDAQLLERRKQIMERVWAEEDSAPSPDAHGVLAAAARAVRELEELLQETDDAEDPLETGRTWRYVADTYFTLSAKKDKDALERGRRAYLRAEPLVEAGGDAVEIAKLNFNLGNTLRLIGGIYDRALLEEAKRRYYRSLQLFRTGMPDAVPQVEESLQSVETGLGALSIYESAQQSHDRLREMAERLQNADPDDAEADREIERELAEFKATGQSPLDQLQKMSALVDQVMPTLTSAASPEEAAAFEQEIRADLAKAHDQLDPEERRRADETNAIFDAAIPLLNEAADRQGVTKERREAGFDILERFKALATESPQSPEKMTTQVGQMRDFISQFKHIYAGLGLQGVSPDNPACARAEVLVTYIQSLRGFVLDETNQSQLGDTERKTLFDFMLRISQTHKALSDAAHDEAATRRVEHDRLRPLAHAMRLCGLRQHLTLAEPLWGWQKVDVNPNCVFFAGGAEVKASLLRVCAERGLELSEKAKGWGAGQVRWNQIRESAVGVFDLTVEGQALASVCHALGSALTLGVYPVVVISEEAGRLPFDIDLSPLTLREGETAAAQLGAALDDALFGLYATTGASSVDETARRVLEMSDGEDATTRVMKRRLIGQTGFDPVEAEEILGSLVSINGRGKAALLLPVWPGFYPEQGQRRCFHVMPFREKWSDEVRDLVKRACGRKAKYRRGDETDEQRIIHSIWEEICRATHVVVDLTNLNLNVCLELGVAQALGRPTLLVAQEGGTVNALFPEISKLQVKPYTLAEGGKSLSAHVAAFLKQ
ncbi:MAG: hypothetical protein H7Z38_24285 [Rubrivivax sp.]|nr:hypothetical protein [Pyrinomonadaceae bacterium]